MTNLQYQACFEVGRLYQAYVQEVTTIRRQANLKLLPGHPDEDPKLRLIRHYQTHARRKLNYSRKIRKPYSKLFQNYEF